MENDHDLTPEQAAAILKARAMLDGLPVPTKGRYVFDPVTGEIIGPIDAD